MKILAVDDEAGALRVLKAAISAAEPTAEILCFQTGRECLEYCQNNPCPDIAFLDIRITTHTGLELARELTKVNPKLNVIFTTGYSEFATDAFTAHASGYLLKPVTPAMISEELNNLRFPVEHSHKGLYAQTFGTFEVFFDEKPLVFKYAKSKELFAYLLDRQGAMCTNEAVMATLWETEGHENYFRQIRKDLTDVLTNIGCGLVLLRRRGTIGLDMSLVGSDFQDYKQGISSAIASYKDEYMSQYSWAEPTNALLWQELG